MDDIKKLKKIRAITRTAVTKVMNKLEKEFDSQSIDLLQEHFDYLNEHLIQLRELDNKIQNIIQVEDEFDAEIQSTFGYNEKISMLCSKIKIQIKTLTKSDPSVSSQATVNVQNDSFNNSINGSSVNSNKNVNSVRLPKLQIDKYFGDPCLWLEFWNKFQNSIDKNETLTKVDKFSYLKSLLGGAAGNVVNGFALSDDNYDNALILLKERFGREGIVVNAHMSKLLNLYPVKDSNNVIGLRKLYDICKIQIRSLESLDVTSGMYGHLLQPILLKLLPEDLVLDFNRKQLGKKEESTFDVMELLQFLKIEIECRESANLLSGSKGERKKFIPHNSKHMPIVSGDNQNISRSRQNKNHIPLNSNSSRTFEYFTPVIEKKCIYCDSDKHGSELCDDLSVDEKKEILRKQGRCFLCLEKNHRIRDLKVIIENRDEPTLNIEIEALETDQITATNIPVPSNNISKINKQLKGLKLADCYEFRNNKIVILVGADYYYDVVLNRIKRLNDKLVATETLFGWCILGKTEMTNTILGMKIVVEEKLISDDLTKFWELENLGIEANATENISDDVTLKEFESGISFSDNRYSVRLPWKPGMKEQLQDNRTVALKRFRGLQSKFLNDPFLFNEYRAVLEEHKSENIIESVTNELKEDKTIFYLPHTAVIREDKTTSKLRIVFDASSHAKGQLSLNDCLHIGPNLNPGIFLLLVKFRENRVAFTADIKQAFLQIQLDEEDRDVTRFLWNENPNGPEELIQSYRMTRVLFGVSSSPFLLAATIKHYLKRYVEKFPETCEMLNNSLYVDDLVSGRENVEQAFKTSLESVDIFKGASMILRKWQTNSPELRDRWKEIGMDIGQSVESKTQTLVPSKILGVAWNPDQDTFTLTLEGSAARFKPFVKNRIKEIQKYTDPIEWRHCPGKDNPADLLSRGMSASELRSSELWWHGFPWLIQNENSWPKALDFSKEIDIEQIGKYELRKETMVNSTTIESPPDNNLIKRYSSFDTLIITTAWCLRFVNNSKINISERKKDYLNTTELRNAAEVLVKSVQQSEFKSEIKCLQLKHQIPKNSKILSLNPFLDKDGLLRVGGRLKFSNLSDSQKHQLILPKTHHLTDLIINHFHKISLHSGTQTTLFLIRQYYWIPSGQNRVRRVINRCLTCFKTRIRTVNQMMGDLPKDRVVPSRPFEKATHFEVVSDLTTDSFLASLRRFIARRSKPATIWSDNATNFKGAKNVLDILLKYVNLILYKNIVPKKIEAVLNSRPLCPLSADPADLQPLTPGHFLVEAPLLGIPEPSELLTNISLSSRWSLIQSLKNRFWKRWSKEYLGELQARKKWRLPLSNLKLGQLVMLKDPSKIPMEWTLGRIEGIHPGSDGLVRVIRIRTSRGVFTRTAASVCPLPFEDVGPPSNGGRDIPACQHKN
ncbi:uncharacterized protein TNCV_390871 [Trichonephila clavipes]|nr:uncharacterized protein TNCV_390871 [Trichonephila clavipes]